MNTLLFLFFPRSLSRVHTNRTIAQTVEPKPSISTTNTSIRTEKEEEEEEGGQHTGKKTK